MLTTLSHPTTAYRTFGPRSPQMRVPDQESGEQGAYVYIKVFVLVTSLDCIGD